MAGLTDKQQRFIDEYLIDCNATQAAIRAGYSEKTAKEQGCQNLAKLNVEISEAKKVLADKTGITAEEILKELKNFAYSDITETILLSTEEIKELPPEIRRLITGYKKVSSRVDKNSDWEEERVELKFVDKMKAIEMINRHIGFYEKDNLQSSTAFKGTYEELLAEIDKLK